MEVRLRSGGALQWTGESSGEESLSLEDLKDEAEQLEKERMKRREENGDDIWTSMAMPD